MRYASTGRCFSFHSKGYVQDIIILCSPHLRHAVCAPAEGTAPDSCAFITPLKRSTAVDISNSSRAGCCSLLSPPLLSCSCWHTALPRRMFSTAAVTRARIHIGSEVAAAPRIVNTVSSDTMAEYTMSDTLSSSRHRVRAPTTVDAGPISLSAAAPCTGCSMNSSERTAATRKDSAGSRTAASNASSDPPKYGRNATPVAPAYDPKASALATCSSNAPVCTARLYGPTSSPWPMCARASSAGGNATGR
mmetsp:Transcript_8579/g.16233  ORF Transcript_8579/g.16233 Transcript_8579/m.16233 type:complete len:248 (+) Transcript_8579:3229-3972(+)